MSSAKSNKRRVARGKKRRGLHGLQGAFPSLLAALKGPPAAPAAVGEVPAARRLPDPRRDAFERRLPEMLALSPRAVGPVNVAPTTVTMRVLAAQEPLRALRPRIVAELPVFDLARVDALEDYLAAFEYAHLRHRITSSPKNRQPELRARATRVRALLLADAKALARHDLLPPIHLPRKRGAARSTTLAFELVALVAHLFKHWAAIDGKTALTRAELVAAEKVAHDHAVAAGARRVANLPAVESADLRRRAFTLLARAYDDARRALTYLAWRDPLLLRQIPPLSAGRKRRKKPPAPPRDGGPASSG